MDEDYYGGDGQGDDWDYDAPEADDDWDGYDYPDDWGDYPEEWEVWDLDISIAYGEDA